MSEHYTNTFWEVWCGFVFSLRAALTLHNRFSFRITPLTFIQFDHLHNSCERNVSPQQDAATTRKGKLYGTVNLWDSFRASGVYRLTPRQIFQGENNRTFNPADGKILPVFSSPLSLQQVSVSGSYGSPAQQCIPGPSDLAPLQGFLQCKDYGHGFRLIINVFYRH